MGPNVRRLLSQLKIKKEVMEIAKTKSKQKSKPRIHVIAKVGKSEKIALTEYEYKKAVERYQRKIKKNKKN